LSRTGARGYGGTLVTAAIKSELY